MRWLVDEYPALADVESNGPEAAARMVREGRLLAVLDGLDEMPPATLAAALDALDSAGHPLVVTCRADEYEKAVTESGSFLSRAAVLELEPVDVAGVIEFLTAAHPSGDTRWPPVFDHLRANPGGPLAAALSVPLAVYLLRTAYANPATDPYELCDAERFPDSAAIERHLFDAYLPALYGGPTPDGRPSYSPDDVRRWLSALAAHLHRRRSPDVAWWHLPTSLPPLVKVVGLVLLGTFDGVVCGIPLGVVLGPGGFAAGFVGAFSPPVLSMLVDGPPTRPRRVDMRLTRRQFGTEVGVAVVLGLVVGLIITFFASVAVGVALAIVQGVAVSVAVGLLGGVIWRLNLPVDTFHALSPASVLRDDRKVSGVRLLFGLFGISAVVAAAGIIGVQVEIVAGLAMGAAGGTVAGVGIVLMQRFRAGDFAHGLSASPWAWFLVTRVWLAVSGRAPWRLVAFLEDAHRRGVLRRVGAAYQFRHALLQDWLRNT